MPIDLSSLNPEQREAAQTMDGPLLVLAGAGTGKTTVITYRIAWMMEHGVQPSEILAVTFTNKAAREMKERVHKMIPGLKENALTVSTFHSFCCNVLRRHIGRLGYDTKFAIADDEDQKSVLKQAMAENGQSADAGLGYSFFRAGISKSKNENRDPEATRQCGRASFFKTLGDVYESYQRLLKEMNLVDFDDLLLLTVRLFDEHPDVLRSFTERYHYIQVDEYQDTNLVQAELIRRLVGERRNLCVVGDDDQSIYGWRGANVENILDFEHQYPGARIIKLEQNYRSTNSILNVANHVIGFNRSRHGKALWSKKEIGEDIRLMDARDETAEALMIAQIFQHHYFEDRIAFDDMAVLMRSNGQAGALEAGFRQMGVPYRLVGAKSFFESREIKDVLAYLRIVNNPRQDVSLKRILNTPPRGIGDKTQEQIREYAGRVRQPLVKALADGVLQMELSNAAASGVRDFIAAYHAAAAEFEAPGNLAEKMRRYLDGIGYIEGLGKIYKDHDEATQRASEIMTFLQFVHDWEISNPNRTLQEYLESNALDDDSNKFNDRTAKGVGATLLTVHAAKGLEFPVVAVVGLEDGLFPHERALEEGSVDEERRLFYVAVTRAKLKLYLSRAVKRTTGKDAGKLRRPSRFLREVPGEFSREEKLESILKPASKEEVGNFFAQMRAKLSE